MPHRLRKRWAFSFFAVIALGLLAAANAGAMTKTASAPRPSCATQVNDTPSKLIACINQKDLWSIMQKFQAIADANPSPADGHPSRNTGEPGYKASADYVANVMRAAGYSVVEQPYKVLYYAYTSQPTFSESSPTAHTFTAGVDWEPGQATGTATSAAVQPVGGFVLPPTAQTSSTSGCSSADFAGFGAGHVALIQRGGCNFGVKVQNAQAAHASAVIIFNEGNPGRTDLLNGSLEDANNNTIVPTIPVAFTSFDTGISFYNEYRAGTPPLISMSIQALVNPNADDWNVIADSPGGDVNHTVVVDAHLDAIYGAGMLDNASGSATILDVAQQMKNVDPLNHLRFIWFGGEETGLFGSANYINTLSNNDLSHTVYDLDADVTASPNYIIGVLDPAAPDFFGGTVSNVFPNRVYKPSTIARDQAVQYFDSIGLNHEFLGPTGTDAINFNQVGIPASGLLTGQDCCKTQHEVDLFGGSLGNYEGNIPSFDGGCVDNPFRWCDNLTNNDPAVLTFMTKAFATMVVQMAYDTKIASSSTSLVYKKKLPIAGETGRRFTTK